MALTWPFKDPDEVLDYTLNWADRLGDDVIDTSEWPDPPDGITIDSDEHDDTVTTLWLSGGEIGITYIFTNRVVTIGGRTLDQSVKLKVKTR
jgi:hypothetical protein